MTASTTSEWTCEKPPPPVLLRGILTVCGARVSLYIDQMPEGEPDEDGPCKRRHHHASRPRLLTVAV